MERSLYNVITVGARVTFTLREAGEGVERFSFRTVPLADVIAQGGKDWTEQKLLDSLQSFDET